MAYRFIVSNFTVSSSASDEEQTSAITNLNNLIPEAGEVSPVGLRFIDNATGGAVPVDITCKRLILRSTVDPEIQYQIYRSAVGLPLAELSEEMKAEAGDGTPLSDKDYNVEHGLELFGVYSNAVASPTTVQVLWKIDTEYAMLGGM